MTITAIVTRVGEPRTFEGNAGTVTAREIELQSGAAVFVASAFDQTAARIESLKIGTGDTVIVELSFTRSTFQTKDGHTGYRQNVNATAIQLVSTNHF